MELFQPKTAILQMTYFFFFCGFPTASVTWTLTAIVSPISSAYISRTPDHNQNHTPMTLQLPVLSYCKQHSAAQSGFYR